VADSMKIASTLSDWLENPQGAAGALHRCQ
jgi:hypothetical protein